jgi:hypothetical protein
MAISFGAGMIDRPEDERQRRRGDIPWAEILAAQKPVPPAELFAAMADFIQRTKGGGQRTSSGFLQAPTELEQVRQGNQVWQERFQGPDAAIAREQAQFPGGGPTFTQQEQARRAMGPQDRINAAMGGDWANLSPQQRRVILQQRTGQVPDMVDPLTNQAPQPTGNVGYGGPSMINGQPAQQAIKQATTAADRAQATQARPGISADLTSWRKRNPKMHRDISDQVYSMFR